MATARKETLTVSPKKDDDKVKVCIARVGDNWATQGLVLENRKTRRKAGFDADGNQLWVVRTEKRVLLTKSYREVTREHANKLLKMGLVVEYNESAFPDYVNGDEVKYNETLSHAGPPRTEEYQRGIGGAKDTEEELLT